MRKFMLLGATCSAALSVMSGAAFAQTAPVTETPPATQADADTQDGDIVVTATLRNESLQKVPLAVTAVSGEALDRAGVRDVRGLDSVSASFGSNNSNTESGGTTIRLRGVGTTGNNTGLESSVGIFLDGVYLSRPGLALGDLLDVDQVEILRGPQGTLFGRNTSAGALQIRTRKPDLDQIDGFANATYGNYNLVNLQAGVSIPLIKDQLAVRVSGAYRNRDGWLHNAAGGESNDRNRYLVRGQLYWRPDSNVSFRLIGDYQRSKEKCCDSVIVRESSYATAGLYTAAGLPNNGGVTASGLGALQNLRTSNSNEFQDKMTQWGVSGELNWDLNGAKLTSITAYRHSLSEPRNESDMVSASVFSGSVGTSSASPLATPSSTRINTFTQELRLAGSAGKVIDYLVGGFYSDENIRDTVSYTLGADHQAYISAALLSLGLPGPNPARNIFAGGVSSAGNYASNQYRQSGRNWSLFTNNTVHFTDRFGFNFGLRYSNDRKQGSFTQLAANSSACAAVIAQTPLLPASLQALAPIARSLTCFPFTTKVGLYAAGPTEFNRVYNDDELVYTGKLLGELTDNVNVYLSFSRGYKAGGINLDSTAAAAGADPRFRPEKVNAYEAGIKTQLLDRKLTANLALFYQRFTDFQVLDFTGVQYTTFNVAKAQTKGFELEVLARPSRSFTFNGSVTYADARYPNDCGGAKPAAQVATLCGASLTAAPKWVAIAGFDWNHEIGSLRVGFNASARLESDRRTTTQPIIAVAAGTGTLGATKNFIPSPFDVQDANAKVNLRATIGSANGRWSLEFWGTNILNEITYGVSTGTPLRGVSSLPGALNAGGISASRVVFPQEPRMYGVTARTTF